MVSEHDKPALGSLAWIIKGGECYLIRRLIQLSII